MKKIIFVLIIVILLLPKLNAQEKNTFHIKIEYISNGTAQYICNKVKSYINRNLQDLNDVIITDINYEYVIKVFILEKILILEKNPTDRYRNKLESQKIIGISVIITHEPHNKKIRELAHYKFDFVSEKSLKEICEQVVTDIDNDFFEERRQIP